MDPILSAVLASMQTDMARMERVGMNLANVLTPGYKGDVLAAQPFSARLETANPPAAVKTDQRAGTLRATGQPLDLAISGPGWFEVMTEQGPAYTRQGNFRLDAQGRLVTHEGNAVMGTGGEIQVMQGAPRIDSAGRVFDANAATASTSVLQAVAQLRVVRFEPSSAMQRLGGGLWRIDGEPTAAAESSSQVQQGVLENSNVSPMHEMVRLMETMRHAEAMQKLAIGYDEMLATSIRRLGEGT